MKSQYSSEVSGKTQWHGTGLEYLRVLNQICSATKIRLVFNCMVKSVSEVCVSSHLQKCSRCCGELLPEFQKELLEIAEGCDLQRLFFDHKEALWNSN